MLVKLSVTLNLLFGAFVSSACYLCWQFHTAVVDRADWWNDKDGKKSKDVTLSQSTSSSCSKGSSKVHSQPLAKSFAVPSEQKKFNYEMAMHFYNTRD